MSRSRTVDPVEPGEVTAAVLDAHGPGTAVDSDSNAYDFTVQPEIEAERYELRAAPGYQFAITRRSLFRALGAGLLVLALIPDADAQESGRRGGARGGGGPTDIGAWLHFSSAGVVTVFTGKTEVGQNIRTSLSQAVAEELRIEPAAVTMVMADTELTPYDMGTFGSRTTPAMAPIMHRAAAAAREALVDRAAEMWQVDRGTITVAGGSIRHAASNRSTTYGKLLNGQQLTREIPAGVSETPRQSWTVAGTSVPKADGRAFVTGAHRYTSDIAREGMVYGCVVRPPSWSAKLKSADGGAVSGLKDVTFVHDANFVGITAPTSHAARAAAGLVKVEWESGEQASEAQLWETLRPGPLAGAGGGGQAPGQTRLAEVYRIAYIAHAPLEPRAAVAEWNNDRLTVWTGTQRPFGVRSDLARALSIPESSIRVITPDTGSGYGGKHTGECAIECARLALAAKRPVKLVWSREEEFNWAYFRPAGVIEVTGVAAADGTLAEWEFHNYNSGGSGLPTPYEAGKKREQFHPSPSPLKQGSYRGLAATANHFARESHMDDLARALKLDPLAFRRKNLKDERLMAVLDAAAARFGWDGRKPAPGRGFGLAAGTEKGSYVACCVELEADRATGRMALKRIVTAFECGAIVNPTHLQNQVEGATVMGIGGALFEAIHFEAGRVTNGRFSKYRVPRFGDVPPIEVVLVDRKDLPSAGAGETPIVTIAPAIRNALQDAVGIRLHALPMLPDGLARA